MYQINIQLWLVCEPVINSDHVLTLSKRLKVLISTLLSSIIIHHFIHLIPCGLNGQVSHSSLEKAVVHLLQVSAGGRRHVCRCHWPVHALAPRLAWLNIHAGLTFWMCGGAEKHHERWRGFVKDWQNSISRVQSGSEKLDRAWQKAYIKIWRLWKQNMYLLKISVGKLVAAKVSLAKCSVDNIAFLNPALSLFPNQDCLFVYLLPKKFRQVTYKKCAFY